MKKLHPLEKIKRFRLAECTFLIQMIFQYPKSHQWIGWNTEVYIGQCMRLWYLSCQLAGKVQAYAQTHMNILWYLLHMQAAKAHAKWRNHSFVSWHSRGVKFPNKLLALHVPNFLWDAINLKSNTRIVKTSLALHNILLANASGRVEFYILVQVNHAIVTILTSLICLLMLFAKIKFSRKFTDLQYR